MIKFQKGTYNSTNPIINYHINDDLDLFSNECIYFLDGNNGIGKTIFVEQIVLPLLKKLKFPVLFVGQDYELQIFLMCAQSLFPVEDALKNPTELLRVLLSKNNYINALIFDEFDKRCEIEDLNDVLDKSNTSSVLVTTHILSHHRKNYFSKIFKKGYSLNLTSCMSDGNCNKRNVELQCITLWQ